MTDKNLKNPFSGPIHFHESIKSTMITAAALDKPVHGTVVQAGHQTAGRGRGERKDWQDSPGSNLLVTVVLDKNCINIEPRLVSLYLGSALIQLVRPILGEVKIKWPNDLLFRGKKLAGVLCEMKGDLIFAGVGLNVNQREFEGSFKHAPSSIALETGEDQNIDSLLESFLVSLHNTLMNPAPLEDAVTANLYGLNRDATVIDGPADKGDLIRGVIRGLARDGSLLIESAGDTKRIHAGEILSVD